MKNKLLLVICFILTLSTIEGKGKQCKPVKYFNCSQQENKWKNGLSSKNYSEDPFNLEFLICWEGLCLDGYFPEGCKKCGVTIGGGVDLAEKNDKVFIDGNISDTSILPILRPYYGLRMNSSQNVTYLANNPFKLSLTQALELTNSTKRIFLRDLIKYIWKKQNLKQKQKISRI